jgi:hypothetical protein
MMRVKYFMLGFVLSLFACNEHNFKDVDFIGIWQADDGARITIKQDGTCVLSGLNKSIVGIANDETEKLNANGNWKMVENINSGITGGITTGLKVSYDLMDRNGRGGILFYISGRGINENRAPWDLFIWKGDPDEMIKYKFVKQ